MFIVAQETSLPNLDRDLEARLRRDPKVTNPKNETILIKANQQVRYSDFMSVVNQLQTDGYFKISLITEEVTARLDGAADLKTAYAIKRAAFLAPSRLSGVRGFTSHACL